MTAILFDPKERALYADSKSTSCNITTSLSVKKIKVITVKGLGECLFAACGEESLIAQAISWLSGDKDGKPEYMKDDEDGGFFGFILDKSGDLYEVGSPSFEPYYSFSQNEVQSIGSGSTVALAAYAMQPNPKKVMRIVKQLDVYSGGSTFKGWLDGEQWRIESIDA